MGKSSPFGIHKQPSKKLRQEEPDPLRLKFAHCVGLRLRPCRFFKAFAKTFVSAAKLLEELARPTSEGKLL